MATPNSPIDVKHAMVISLLRRNRCAQPSRITSNFDALDVHRTSPDTISLNSYPLSSSSKYCSAASAQSAPRIDHRSANAAPWQIPTTRHQSLRHDPLVAAGRNPCSRTCSRRNSGNCGLPPRHCAPPKYPRTGKQWSCEQKRPDVEASIKTELQTWVSVIPSGRRRMTY